MGKCTKKAKMTADVALTDVSQSYLGVRTHAKTLALHRLPSAAAAALPPSKPDACYLELRSRRLEKPMQPQNSRNTRRSCGCRGKEKAEIGRHEGLSPPDSTLKEGLEIEASFGETNFDLEARKRGTPYSSMGAVDTTTKQKCSSAATQSALPMNASFARELEEFFAPEEKSMQRHFVEKYNFDIVRDLPLPGHYEWLAVRP